MTMKLFPLVLVLSIGAFAQSGAQKMYDTERTFAQVAAEDGVKPAFLRFLTSDAIIFEPGAANGLDVWSTKPDGSPARMVRTPLHADVASNALIGYTTGLWQLFPKGKSDTSTVSYGQYATVWRRLEDGSYRAVVDIQVRNGEPIAPEDARMKPSIFNPDANERGWSAADPSMNFLKMSMGRSGLSGAYKKFAGADMRLLRDGMPPIMGKESVIKATRDYRSIGYPKKVALTESGDMAYVWNQCQFADNDEGTTEGNCLHVWKLRNEKWYIVLGAITAVPVMTPPKLINSAATSRK